ncbi:RNA-guided pseudouridylation complex pseudouridine synthase subunit Cbf5 [Haloarcula halophila]|uniref:RNA-guided pseudouridylation complex pseudouridine synthase subunit Cbf5 n=1 Tax=Haloarcula TaxID=2237 RepID=UPI0023E3D066|nr:RNA-guided pseudouridylation complex pseudouridine synthase subunit Cbf5 [Halomicroarcula sp. DFY41]
MTLRGPPEDRPLDTLRSFGVVNLDKPPGPSAHQVAAWVRDATGQDRVAHGGTLDPKVTGCLPVLLGDAARAARVFDDAVKEYVAVLELHATAPADFETVVAEFETEIYQKPPRKSAVKRQLRSRQIHALDVLERGDRRALLRVRCESGTYIRKLCHDIGLALGTGAHMGDLRRTATGRFDDTALVTMHDLVDALAFADEGDETALREAIQPAERALVDLPRVTIAPSAAHEIADGAPVYAPGVIDTEPAPVGGNRPEQDALVACCTPDGAVVCLGTLTGDPDADSGVVVTLERVLV